MEIITIDVDWENNAETWWEAAREHPDLPAVLLPLFGFDGTDYVVVTPEEGAEALEWAKSLPGWDTGPDYAPNPLLFSEGYA